jgi:hypothetical protein
MKDSSVKLLKRGITRALGGPGGDPDQYHNFAAACMVQVLIDEEVPVDEETILSLRKDNIYKYDFMAEIKKEKET